LALLEKYRRRKAHPIVVTLSIARLMKILAIVHRNHFFFCHTKEIDLSNMFVYSHQVLKTSDQLVLVVVLYNDTFEDQILNE